MKLDEKTFRKLFLYADHVLIMDDDADLVFALYEIFGGKQRYDDLRYVFGLMETYEYHKDTAISQLQGYLSGKITLMNMFFMAFRKKYPDKAVEIDNENGSKADAESRIMQELGLK